MQNLAFDESSGMHGLIIGMPLTQEKYNSYIATMSNFLAHFEINNFNTPLN
jgi:hypothetical protein